MPGYQSELPPIVRDLEARLPDFATRYGVHYRTLSHEILGTSLYATLAQYLEEEAQRGQIPKEALSAVSDAVGHAVSRTTGDWEILWGEFFEQLADSRLAAKPFLRQASEAVRAAAREVLPEDYF